MENLYSKHDRIVLENLVCRQALNHTVPTIDTKDDFWEQPILCATLLASKTISDLPHIIFNKGFRQQRFPPESILDEENPTSTGDIITARNLCEAVVIAFSPEFPRMFYSRGWGRPSLDPKPIICSWTLIARYINQQPTLITFDLTDGDSPLTAGLELQRHSKRDFVSTILTISFKQFEDIDEKTLSIHTKGTSLLEMQAYLDVIGIQRSTRSLTKTSRPTLIRPTTFAKRLHRYTHASAQDMISIIKHAGYNVHEAQKLCKTIRDS